MTLSVSSMPPCASLSARVRASSMSFSLEYVLSSATSLRRPTLDVSPAVMYLAARQRESVTLLGLLWRRRARLASFRPVERDGHGCRHRAVLFDHVERLAHRRARRRFAFYHQHAACKPRADGVDALTV